MAPTMGRPGNEAQRRLPMACTATSSISSPIAGTLTLAKPRVVFMVAVTTLVGYYLGAAGALDLVRLVHVLVGTALAAGGTLALNQYFERDVDACMARTCRRPLPDGRLAFFLGDVSGKGMPAALFMIAVRTLISHLAPAASSAAEVLERLNRALAGDNPTALFVTLLHGIYDRRDGSVVLASGGHPPPLRRRHDGRVEEIALSPGLMLGMVAEPRLSDTFLSLEPGETLIVYTDGFTEAFARPNRWR